MAQELTQSTIDVIINTADMVVSNSTQITKSMYKILFAKYPHVENLFKDQPQNQYMILSEALSLFAVNIDKIDKLTPALNRIAVTHVRTNVKAGHYPMVGLALLTAMEDVLTDRATVEFIDAWREVYQYLSNVLIDMENTMYEDKN